jgi:hypothetical protein
MLAWQSVSKVLLCAWDLESAGSFAPAWCTWIYGAFNHPWILGQRASCHCPARGSFARPWTNLALPTAQQTRELGPTAVYERVSEENERRFVRKQKGFKDRSPALTKPQWRTVGDVLMSLEESVQDTSLWLLGRPIRTNVSFMSARQRRQTRPSAQRGNTTAASCRHTSEACLAGRMA